MTETVGPCASPPLAVLDDGILDFLGDAPADVETDYDARPTLDAVTPMVRAGWSSCNRMRRRLIERRVPGRVRAVWVGGGGTNELGQQIAWKVDEAVAVDPSLIQLRNTPRLGATTILVRGVGEDLSIADGWADLIEMQGVLDHVTDPTMAVAEAVRVTRPGGLVIAAMTNDGSWFRRFARRLGARGFEQRDTHAWRMSASDLEAMLRDAGVRQIEIAGQMYLRLPRALDRAPLSVATAVTFVADTIGNWLAPRSGGIAVVSGLAPSVADAP